MYFLGRSWQNSKFTATLPEGGSRCSSLLVHSVNADRSPHPGGLAAKCRHDNNNNNDNINNKNNKPSWLLPRSMLQSCPGRVRLTRRLLRIQHSYIYCRGVSYVSNGVWVNLAQVIQGDGVGTARKPCGHMPHIQQGTVSRGKVIPLEAENSP